MKNILISGANGFIGSRLCNYLYLNGNKVIGLVRKGADTSLINNKLSIEEVDYNDNERIAYFMNQADIFIHCAAQTKARSFDEICKNNVDLTLNMINISNNSASIKHFIFISSQAAGGPGNGHQEVRETDIPMPISWYGKSKLLAEKNIQKHCQKDWTILRSASVYGPGDKDFFAYFQLIEKHLAIHPGMSDKHISLIFIDDLIKIIDQIMYNKNAFSQIYYCSDGKIYTMKKFIDNLSLAMGKLVISLSVPDYLVSMTGAVAEMIGRLQRKLPILNRQKAKEFNQKNWLCSNSKLINTIDFKPERLLLDNLIITYDWYKKNDWIKE